MRLVSILYENPNGPITRGMSTFLVDTYDSDKAEAFALSQAKLQVGEELSYSVGMNTWISIDGIIDSSGKLK